MSNAEKPEQITIATAVMSMADNIEHLNKIVKTLQKNSEDQTTQIESLTTELATVRGRLQNMERQVTVSPDWPWPLNNVFGSKRKRDGIISIDEPSEKKPKTDSK